MLNNEIIVKEKKAFKEIQSYFSQSNVILDLPFLTQNGYSHRLITALANGCMSSNQSAPFNVLN